MACRFSAALVLALTLGIAAPAQVSADAQEGAAAFKAGDYQTALREFLPVADAGNPEIQNIIAGM